jgi:hypothetical protein
MGKNCKAKKKQRADMKKSQSQETKSVGTMIAEKAREKANDYNDAKRSDLLDKGLALIYGNNGYAKCNCRSR